MQRGGGGEQAEGERSRQGANTHRLTTLSSSTHLILSLTRTHPSLPLPSRSQDSGSWGAKLKIDVNLPILGLATHPSDSSLVMLLHADGMLRCYQGPSSGGSGVALEGLAMTVVFATASEWGERGGGGRRGG
jgi:hypothetical protein